MTETDWLPIQNKNLLEYFKTGKMGFDGTSLYVDTKSGVYYRIFPAGFQWSSNIKFEKRTGSPANNSLTFETIDDERFKDFKPIEYKKPDKPYDFSKKDPNKEHKNFIKSFSKDIQKAIIKIENEQDEDIRNIFDFDNKSEDEIKLMLGI